MIVAILIFTILNFINTFFICVILLSIYGKCEDVIEYFENMRDAIKGIAKGFNESLKGMTT